MYFLKYSSKAIILLLLLASCGIKVTTQTTKTIAIPTEVPSRLYSVQSVMWQQNAAEYRALCYQAFNVAKYRLDEILLDDNLKGKKLAIITDIDETVMDNSPYNAKLILENAEYTPDTWFQWSEKEEALPIPGATKFLNYAASKNVEIFYVSNREDREKAATIENMKKIHFPYADDKHTLFKIKESKKEERFNKVKEEYTVVLYMGDNLSDFSNKFTEPSTTYRNSIADELQNEFGKKFIVLPNPMYGDWEMKGIYQGKYNWTYEQRDSIQKSSLRSY